MPQQVKVTERYWCPGPWPWQWFDTYGPGRMCFDSPLSRNGQCARDAVTQYALTAEVPRVQATARRRLRAPRHEEADVVGDEREEGESR